MGRKGWVLGTGAEPRGWELPSCCVWGGEKSDEEEWKMEG